jgi:hypothetical protein
MGRVIEMKPRILSITLMMKYWTYKVGSTIRAFIKFFYVSDIEVEKTFLALSDHLS